MDQSRRLALRAARRLECCYSCLKSPPLPLVWPAEDWQRCERTFRLLRKADARGWLLAGSRLRKQLAGELGVFIAQVSHVREQLAPASECSRPTLRLLLDEILALESEFPQVCTAFANKASRANKEDLLAVHTEPIRFEEIEFGPFEIRLSFDHVQRCFDYRVLALEPSPAPYHSAVTHPHVQGDLLCEGEARQPLRKALEDGRMSDFFLIVTRVLQTYNADSAFAELSEWSGIRCRACGDMVPEEDALRCQSCDDELCNDCCEHCPKCLDDFCSTCLEACGDCERRCCRGCLQPCASCEELFCRGCLTHQDCETCHDSHAIPEDLDGDSHENILEHTPEESATGSGGSLHAP